MKTTRPQNFLTLLLCVFFFNTYAQITTNSNPPYNSPIFLVDSLLLGEGVVATNHIFQGDPLQIGFFNGENSNIGLDERNGYRIVGYSGGFGGFLLITTLIELLELASSVPDLIGQEYVTC